MENNKQMDAGVTGVMNAMGQDGNYKASQMPIKNRVNALDVSHCQSNYSKFNNLYLIL